MTSKARYPIWLDTWVPKDRKVRDYDEQTPTEGFLSEPIPKQSFVDFTRDVLEALDSPRSLAVWLLFYYNEHDQLLDLAPVIDWESVGRYRDDYLATELLSKCVDLNTTYDRKYEALKTLLLSEDLCLETNRIFRLRADGLFSFRPIIEHVLDVARGKIAEVLGPFPSFDKWEPLCSFGPGADMSTREGDVSGYKKFQFPGSVTPNLLEYSLTFCREAQENDLSDDLSISDYSGYDALEHAQCMRGNGVFFVFKNAKTFRTAAKEPRWNSWFQAGLGRYVSEIRLVKFNVNLRDQSANQRAAKRAYFTEECTVDKKMASDTAAVLCVMDLTPSDWFDAFMGLRSPAYKIGKEWRWNQKISSMGNGYTFPLESTIFYGIAYACCRVSGSATEEICVYGDDVVIPRTAFPLYKETLEAIGFVINMKKTKVSGRFFESCGKDYYLGQEVRPIYAKRFPETAWDQIQLCNKLLSWALDPKDHSVADRRMLRSWAGLVRYLPVELRLYGPITASGVLHSTLDRVNLRLLEEESQYLQRNVYTVQSAVAVEQKFHGNSYHAHLYSKLRKSLDCGNAYNKRGHWVLKKKWVTCDPDDFMWA